MSSEDENWTDISDSDSDSETDVDATHSPLQSEIEILSDSDIDVNTSLQPNSTSEAQDLKRDKLTGGIKMAKQAVEALKEGIY